MKDALRAAWAARTPSERRWLAGGALALAVMLFYAFAWFPAQRGVATLDATLPRLRTDLNAMRSQAAEILRLRQSAPKVRLDGAGAMAAVQASAGSRGLQSAVQRIDVLAPDRLRVVLASVAFSAWIEWIDVLRRDHQLAIEAVRVDAIGQAGLAKIEMVLSVPYAR